jgi:hypothetical protein
MKFSILAFGAVLVALVSGLAIPNPEAAVEERGIYSVGRQPVCEEGKGALKCCDICIR